MIERKLIVIRVATSGRKGHRSLGQIREPPLTLQTLEGFWSNELRACRQAHITYGGSRIVGLFFVLVGCPQSSGLSCNGEVDQRACIEQSPGLV